MTGGALNFRRLIVSLQVGLSVLLLVGAGLFVRTMQNLRHVEAGFNPSHLITFHIDPLLSGYDEGEDSGITSKSAGDHGNASRRADGSRDRRSRVSR